MRAFSILSVAAVAIVWLVPTAFAAPATDVKVGARAIDAVHVRAVPGQGYAADTHSGKALARGYKSEEGLDGCAKILTKLKVDLSVHIDLLYGLKEGEVEKETILAILKDIVSCIYSATISVKALIGTGLICDVELCAQLLFDIINALCGVLSFVLGLCVDVEILFGCIDEVGFVNCLCDLISTAIALVDGLLDCLLPLVQPIGKVLVTLKLDIVVNVLNLVL